MDLELDDVDTIQYLRRERQCGLVHIEAADNANVRWNRYSMVRLTPRSLLLVGDC